MSRSTDAEFLEAASTGQLHVVTSILADLSAEEKQRIERPPHPKQPVSLTRPQAAPTIPGPISRIPCISCLHYLLRRRDKRRRTVSCKSGVESVCRPKSYCVFACKSVQSSGTVL